MLLRWHTPMHHTWSFECARTQLGGRGMRRTHGNRGCPFLGIWQKCTSLSYCMPCIVERMWAFVWTHKLCQSWPCFYQQETFAKLWPYLLLSDKIPNIWQYLNYHVKWVKISFQGLLENIIWHDFYLFYCKPTTEAFSFSWMGGVHWEAPWVSLHRWMLWQDTWQSSFRGPVHGSESERSSSCRQECLVGLCWPCGGPGNRTQGQTLL